MVMHESIVSHIEAIISREKVIQAAKDYLSTCEWSLEIDEAMALIPQDVDIIVRSRAFIKADVEHAVFLDDHYEAVVLIGIDNQTPHCAKYGILKMYFNLEGKFISEDRYSQHV
jgi:hypothetical protein